MRRQTARQIHRNVNFSYWAENPNWFMGNPVADTALKAYRKLPFKPHDALKSTFFRNDENLLAVNGESVVVARGDEVDKFMFRYPGKMPIETFKDEVTKEVGIVTACMGRVALRTEVSIKPSTVLRARKPVMAVTQTQPRLDLDIHRAMSVGAVMSEPKSPQRDRTAQDIETLLSGAELLRSRYKYYADTPPGSDNVRRSILDGAVTLIDVLPVHADGGRLIGDSPPNFISHIQAGLDQYQAFADFVGDYGK